MTTRLGTSDKARGAVPAAMARGTTVSDEAVATATGHGWSHWFRVLDRWGAKERTHKEIATYLHAEQGVTGWWSQTVTVEYERARGLRAVGQTADGAFQVGVMKTFDLDLKAAWALVAGPRGLRLWLGAGAPKRVTEGTTFELADGTRGEVRVVKPDSHLRLTWQPPGWKQVSVVQVRIEPRSDGRAAISFHHEKLPGAKQREAMRTHWKGVLETLAG